MRRELRAESREPRVKSPQPGKAPVVKKTIKRPGRANVKGAQIRKVSRIPQHVKKI
jgi:hypothetical protein